MSFRKEQRLNDWVEMLHSIYGLSQNYARSEYEILAHLSEVSGALGKYLFKLQQPDRAREFLPKIFGWTVALLKKVKGERTNLEEILLTKYPGVCPYCLGAPCTCTPGRKQPIDAAQVREAYLRNTLSQGRSLNEYQMLFRRIYETSWGVSATEPGSQSAYEQLRTLYSRLIEELSEMAESVRFEHLYPTNFDNEVADFLAWLFAFVSCIHLVTREHRTVLIEDLFWPAYPGICVICMLDVCDCRPSPVRELLSKPSLRDRAMTDELTFAGNKAQFSANLASVISGSLPLPLPISAIRIDIDNFKRFNERPFNHGVGDEALKHVANILRQKLRNRDRVYRVGGDEFAVLCPDISAAEAAGMMSRVATALKQKAVPASGGAGEHPPTVTLSIGIAECLEPAQIEAAFHSADVAAGISKNEGKDRITLQNEEVSSPTVVSKSN